MPGHHRPFTLYLRLVSAAGFAALVALAIVSGGEFGPADAEFWVLAALVLAGELFPIQVHGQVGEETFSTPFAFALFLLYGTPEVVAVQIVSTLAADLISRRAPDRIVFNLALFTLSWVAAGAVLSLMGGTSLGSGDGLDAADLPAIAAAAIVFFAVNSTLVRTAEAFLQQTNIAGHLRAGLWFRAWSDATLFALGPPVAVIAENWLYLVPILALPMAAVHRASKQASQMEHLALHDRLTALPNRTLLLQRAEQALTGPDRAAALLVFDLDRFRDVNDTLGREQGDSVLLEVARRMKRAIRSSDTVARLEADRFGVLLPGMRKSADAAGAAEKVLAALSRQVDVAGAQLSVDATVGIACAPEHGDNADLVLQRAEAAMYRAKRSPLARRLLHARARGGGARGGSRSSPPSSARSTSARSRCTTSRRSSSRAGASWASRRSPAGPTRSSARWARARSCRSPSAPASPSRSRSSRSRSRRPTARAGAPTAASRRSR